MSRLSESALRQLIKSGETSTVELKLAAPRAVDLAERLCGMANAQGGRVIIGVKDSDREIVGVSDDRIGETVDVILRAARQVIKPTLVLEPPEPEVVMVIAFHGNTLCNTLPSFQTFIGHCFGYIRHEKNFHRLCCLLPQFPLLMHA